MNVVVVDDETGERLHLRDYVAQLQAEEERTLLGQEDPEQGGEGSGVLAFEWKPSSCSASAVCKMVGSLPQRTARAPTAEHTSGAGTVVSSIHSPSSFHHS